MLYSMDQVALYLNRAVLLAKKNGGSLKFITGNDATKVRFAGARAEETQCLTFGDAVWLANNDDEDTLTQKDFLDKLGVATKQELMDHVDNYQSKVMSYMKGQFQEGAMTAEEKLLYRLATRNDEFQTEKFSMAPNLGPAAAAAANPVFKLSSANPPSTSGILFVTGNYTGKAVSDGGEHAEQKLLAALSKASGTVTGNVTVSGCKMACSTCERVLSAAQEKLVAKSIRLFYTSTFVDNLRNEVKLAKKNSVGIKDLDVDKYFG